MQRKINEICAIIVVSCDEYKDVAILNSYYKKLYCPKCILKYYLVTQQKGKELEGMYDDIFYAGENAKWTDRVLFALKQINFDYVILLCDDFFIHQKIDYGWLSEQIEFMKRENVGCVKLIYTGKPQKATRLANRYWNLNEREAFRISFTAGLWRRDYLKRILNEGESAWEAERTSCINSRKYIEKICAMDKQYIDIFHTVMSGGWIRKAYKRFIKDEIPLDLYNNRPKKKLYLYLKDLIYNILIVIFDQEFIVKLQNNMKIGRR